MRAHLAFLRALGLWTLGGSLLFGCADSSWEGARRKDTVGSYHQFLRDHPASRYAPEARERLAFLRVKNLPTLEAFEEFESVYPRSPLTAELRVVVEPLFFAQAREANTPEAYGEFLARYPNGELTAKARGNLEYTRAVRTTPSAAALRAFLEAHPESDFASEADSTLALIETRRATTIGKLGVRVEVAPNVVQPNRVRRGFSAVVARAYRDVSVQVVVIPPGEPPGADLDAWMRIDYHEAPASGTFGGRTLLSHCRMRLYHQDSEVTIWDRKFEAPADHVLKGAYGRDKTVFGNSKYRFWESFFVPVSTWAASHSRIQTLSWPEGTQAIHIKGDRAAVLLERGGVDFIDVSAPLEPKVLQRYRRESDLSRWEGVRIINDRFTLIYGADGAELLRRNDLGVERTARWEVPEVGAVHDVADYDGRTAFLAGGKGLFALRLNQKPLMPHRLLDGEAIGVSARHPYVYVVRKDRVEVATAKHLLRHLTGTKVPLGKFRALRVRETEDSLFLFGKTHVAEVTLADPQQPKVVSLLDMEELGRISDVVQDGTHLYLLGARGLQVAAPRGTWVSDAIQVAADRGAELRGRFAFLVGGKHLEVLDLAPYYGTAVAAPAD